MLTFDFFFQWAYTIICLLQINTNPEVIGLVLCNYHFSYSHYYNVHYTVIDKMEMIASCYCKKSKSNSTVGVVRDETNLMEEAVLSAHKIRFRIYFAIKSKRIAAFS